MQETMQRIIKCLACYCRISWSRNARTRRHSKYYKTKLIGTTAEGQNLLATIFQLAELVFFLKTIECLCLRTIGLIVAPWKFDVLKISIFVLRTSNFRGAAISRQFRDKYFIV